MLESGVLLPRFVFFRDAGHDHCLASIVKRTFPKRTTHSMPAWLYSEGDDAEYTLEWASKTVSTLSHAQVGFLRACADGERVDPSAELKRVEVDTQQTYGAPKRLVAWLRARCGAEMERRCITAWEKKSAGAGGVSQADTTTLLHDSYVACCWTQANARLLIEESHESAAPSLASFFNSDSELGLSCAINLGNLAFDHSNKDSTIHQLIGRSLNASNRSWTSTMTHCVRKSSGLRLLIYDGLIVSLTGMHPGVDPLCRPTLEDRILIETCVRGLILRNRKLEELKGVCLACRQVVRRLLATSLTDALPAYMLLRLQSNSPLDLGMAPLDAPSSQSLQVSNALAKAGSAIAHDLRSADCSDATFDVDTVASIVERHLADLIDVVPHTSRQGNSNSGFKKRVFNARLLGLQTLRIPHVKRTPTLLQLVQSLTSVSYHSQLIPFWSVCNSLGIKMSRLDQAQHAASHLGSPMIELCQSLDDASVEHARRCAMHCKTAPMMSCEEVATAMRLHIGSSPSSKPISNVNDLMNLAPRILAMLIEFAMTAHLLNEVLVYRLDSQAERMQKTALMQGYNLIDCKRLLRYATGPRDVDLVGEVDEAIERLPRQVTHLCMCLECGRVANATPVRNDKILLQDKTMASGRNNLVKRSRVEAPFNEEGIKMVMSDTKDEQFYCSKRSSASLRTALVNENDARKSKIDVKISNMSSDVDSSGVTIEVSSIARMRRECRRAMEQKSCALACGSKPMFEVPIVGRAVRIFGTWYALCSFCGCVVVADPGSKLGATISCLQCQTNKECTTSVRLKDAVFAAKVNRTSRSKKKRRETVQHGITLVQKLTMKTLASSSSVCRYCSCALKSIKKGRSVNARLHSPLDMKGANAGLPSELKYTQWCTKHRPSWLEDALKVMRTNCILAYIAHNARPMEASTCRVETPSLSDKVAKTTKTVREKTLKRIATRMKAACKAKKS